MKRTQLDSLDVTLALPAPRRKLASHYVQSDDHGCFSHVNQLGRFLRTRLPPKADPMPSLLELELLNIYNTTIPTVLPRLRKIMQIVKENSKKSSNSDCMMVG